MARHGTTTVEVKSGCGGGPRAELKLLRALSLAGQDPIEVVATFLLRLPAPAEGPDPAEAAVEWACAEFLRCSIAGGWPSCRYRLEPRREPAAADPALPGDGCPAWLGLPGARRWRWVARSGGAGVRSADRRHRPSGANRGRGTGGLAASGPVITLLPGLAFHTGSRPAPARALLEAGAAVALGSNFNRSDSPMLNMQTVVSLACRELE